jgi:methionyl-tRNA formyltransferase
VKSCAQSLGIPILQPTTLRNNTEFSGALARLSPDLIVTASYGNILPEAILGLPRLGGINIHASLLPKYRGAAPIQWVILNGETVTGVTLIYMTDSIDAGDMIAQNSLTIDEMNAGALTERLADEGARLLLETLPSIADGTVLRVPQEDSLATYARMIESKDAYVDLTQSAAAAVRQVRAMNPTPGAFVVQDDVRIKIARAHVASVAEAECAHNASGSIDAIPGSVVAVGGKGIFVQTGDGILVIDMLCMPGKRPLMTADYLRGNRFSNRPITAQSTKKDG